MWMGPIIQTQMGRMPMCKWWARLLLGQHQRLRQAQSRQAPVGHKVGVIGAQAAAAALHPALH